MGQDAGVGRGRAGEGEGVAWYVAFVIRLELWRESTDAGNGQAPESGSFRSARSAGQAAEQVQDEQRS